MRKLTYSIIEETDRTQTIQTIYFVTNRTPKWTEEQYLRNRANTKMILISDEEIEEQEPTSGQA